MSPLSLNILLSLMIRMLSILLTKVAYLPWEFHLLL